MVAVVALVVIILFGLVLSLSRKSIGEGRPLPPGEDAVHDGPCSTERAVVLGEAETSAKDDLKTLPLAEVEKRLGSSPDGLTQAEAAKRLTQYGRTSWWRRRPIPFSSSSRTSGAQSPG